LLVHRQSQIANHQSMDTPNILEITHLTKALPAALEDVSFQVAAGSIYGLVGDTGSGRHTLMKILAGIHPAGTYEGHVSFDGQPLLLKEPREAIRAGISVVPRRGGVFDTLSVAENIMVTSWQVHRRFLVVRGQIEQQAAAVMEKWNVSMDPHVPAGSLTPAQKREVMILRALCTDPRLVVLEEPLADLSSVQSVSQIMWLIRRIVEHGLTILYMARRPSNPMQVADRITVLRDGQVAGTWDRDGFDETTLLTASLSRRMGELGDFEGELTEEPRGFLGSLRNSLGRVFAGDR
jgi:ribose transport system ATP-binding protein/D-xylose transport system ATP-binding protein